jgi:hypothetical protein
MDAELRVDGNAVAGTLTQVLAVEPTMVLTACARCGASNRVGAMPAYQHGMGAILTCPGCAAVMIRIGSPSGRVVLDLRGVRWMQVEVG